MFQLKLLNFFWFLPTETTSDLVGNKISEKSTKTASKSTHEDPGKLITSAQTDEPKRKNIKEKIHTVRKTTTNF